MSEVERVHILRLTEEGKTSADDVVVREFPLTIVLNNQELVTLLCSPQNLDYLAVGFLLSQGLIKEGDDIKKIIVDEKRGMAQVETKNAVDISMSPVLASSGARGTVSSSIKKVSADNKIKLSASRIFSLMEDFAQRSRLFRSTGGVHSAALCDANSILLFSEDIGRHNAIDKIFGECILTDIPTDGRILVTSGRVSSEILLKAAKRNIPLLISRSAPTDLGVKLAEDLGITLIGFVRGKRMNVYANDWRIVSHG